MYKPSQSILSYLIRNWPKFMLSLTYSFFIPYFLSIIIFVLLIFCYNILSTTQPYNRVCLNTFLKNLPRSLIGILLSHTTPDASLHLTYSHLVLCFTIKNTGVLNKKLWIRLTSPTVSPLIVMTFLVTLTSCSLSSNLYSILLLLILYTFFQNLISIQQAFFCHCSGFLPPWLYHQQTSCTNIYQLVSPF